MSWESEANSFIVDKVFRKMGFQITKEDIDDVVNARPEGIERILRIVKMKIQRYLQRKRENPITYSPQRRHASSIQTNQSQKASKFMYEQEALENG